MTKLFLIFTALALCVASPVTAQDLPDPYVPCPGCENFQHAPYPETGMWYDPSLPGSGFVFEFQNGYVAGFYFGYDRGGDPDWTMFSGRLEQSDDPGVLWSVELEMQRYCADGTDSCIPILPEPTPPYGMKARVDFMQRGFAQYARSFFNSPYDENRPLIPITFGSVSRAYFPEMTPYLLPELTADPSSSLWTFVFSEDRAEPWTRQSIVLFVMEAELSTTGTYAGKLVYRLAGPQPPPEGAIGFGEIVCDPGSGDDELICVLTRRDDEYRIPLGNFTDSRLFGESEDGKTVEAFRLDYD